MARTKEVAFYFGGTEIDDVSQGRKIKWRNTLGRFGAVTRSLHWVIISLFLALFVLAYLVKYTTGYDSEMGALHLYWHKAVGMAVLVLAVIWLRWRALNIEPPLPGAMPALHKLLVHLTHWVLFTILIVQPLAGLAMDVFHGEPVFILGTPIFPVVMERNASLAKLADMVHNDYMDIIIGLVVAAHAGAALKHHFINKDDMLAQMLPGWAGGKR